MAEQGSTQRYRPGRSLRLSTAGIERAREALVRRNLIQKSLEEEGIASWSTINKFFTGKPVARTIFLEICHRLDLNWEEIVDSPPISEDEEPSAAYHAAPNPPESGHFPWLNNIQKASTANREALTPRILQPITRSIVQERYLPTINRGLKQGIPRMIALIGPAGYGKSTILGHLYDHLANDRSGWTALLLCSSLYLQPGASSQQLAISLAEVLCGEARPLPEITAALTSTQGRGTLLIDTLDLVISRSFISAFSTIVRQLLEQGVTIVFTCRDYEYNDFLEPTREKLAGIAQWLDRQSVPGFTDAEIQLAAETFFSTLEPPMLERGTRFAQQILSLSADNRSLRDITQNPLLLALLCDLFAWDDNVPADLTVSKLYQRYWTEKIAYSRSDGSHSSLLALEKEQVCLTIAQSLFEQSHEKLCESAYPDELGITSSASIADAYRDLLSEGVLEVLPIRKVHFFHQTLLEYAIAYWLTRHTAQTHRSQLLEALQEPEASYRNTYWLPILRQLLTIVESESEFESLVEQLNTSDVGLFGAVAFAAASRDRPDALLRLLPTALELGEAHQKRLRQALESAPRQLAEEGWNILLALVERADHTTAINTAKMISTLLARWWNTLGVRLPEAMAAIAKRAAAANQQTQRGQDDRIQLMGWLLQHCLPELEAKLDLTLLSAVRQHYPLLGFNTCSAVIRLHQMTDVPDGERQAFLQQMLSYPTPSDRALRDEMVAFTASLLPTMLSGGSGLWDSWSAVLQGQYTKGWDTLLALAIGRCAAWHQPLLLSILNDLSTKQSERRRRNFIVIGEAIRQGADGFVTEFLTGMDICSLTPELFDSLIRFLDHQVAKFSPAYQERLAQWLQPAVTIELEPMLFLLDALANGSTTARQLLETAIAQLPLDQQSHYQARLLRFQPIADHPPLSRLDKSAQLFLIKLYRERAVDCSVALDRLLAATQSNSKEVAIAASQEMNTLAVGRLSVEQLLPFLQSRFPGVRVNGLEAIQAITNQGLELMDGQLNTLCTLLGNEDNQAVVRPLCEVVARWVQTNRRVPPAVAVAIGEIPARLLQRNTFEGGAARVVMMALKAIAQSEDKTLNPQQAGDWTRALLMGINLIKIPHSETEMLDLLSAVDRLDKTFLAIVVSEDCPVLVKRQWLRNVFPVIRAIRRVEGKESALLDAILDREWCIPQIRNLILEVRGG